jgi:hypothetical protein
VKHGAELENRYKDESFEVGAFAISIQALNKGHFKREIRKLISLLELRNAPSR